MVIEESKETRHLGFHVGVILRGNQVSFSLLKMAHLARARGGYVKGELNKQQGACGAGPGRHWAKGFRIVA